jgi:hypothetical protein
MNIKKKQQQLSEPPLGSGVSGTFSFIHSFIHSLTIIFSGSLRFSGAPGAPGSGMVCSQLSLLVGYTSRVPQSRAVMLKTSKSFGSSTFIYSLVWNLLSGQESAHEQKSQAKTSKRPREPLGEGEELPEPGPKHTRQDTEPSAVVSKDAFSYMGMPFC